MNKERYELEDVISASVKYFNGDALAARVWADKYALKDSDEKLLELTPDDMHRRLSYHFARIEKKYPNPISEEEIYESFKGFKRIVPQGRVMAGLGATESYRSLSNCLVLPSPEDSYSSIMYTDVMLVSSAKRGCGYGIDLSNIRPTGDKTTNAALTSTGIVPFMSRYSNSTREVGQDSRRGACLLGLDINHPDSVNFLTAKKDKTQITGANISLKVYDDFMHALMENKDYDLTFKGKVYKTVKAADLWKIIVSTAHADAEPGLFYFDRMCEYDPVSVYENHKITLTNACGEQPMGKFSTCRLIVINLFTYVDFPFTRNAAFNFKRFDEDCKRLLIYADDLVDLEIEYVDRILKKVEDDPEDPKVKAAELDLWSSVKDVAISGRRVGCGITGLGDMLAALNLTYDSEESIKIIEAVGKAKFRSELEASIDLARDRGAFPDWDGSLEYKDGVPQNSFYKMMLEEFPDLVERMMIYGRRNINWSTIAPTGTTSLLTQTTSGCEPLFSAFHKRKRKLEKNSKRATSVDKNGDSWEEYYVMHPKFEEWWITNSDYSNDPELGRQQLRSLGEHELIEAINTSPYRGSSAEEISWKRRIEIQATLQKYITSAISSTINLPESITVDEVSQIYKYGWQMGLKGQTIYRVGSRDGILTSGTAKKAETPSNFIEHNAPKRPKDLPADYYYVTSQGRKYAVIVGLYENKPYEIFAFENPSLLESHKGKITKVKKGEYRFTSDRGEIHKLELAADLLTERAHTILLSMLLRHGAPVKHIINVATKIDDTITSFSSVCRRVLSKYVPNEVQEEKCPECGGKIVREEGCVHCTQCSYSRC